MFTTILTLRNIVPHVTLTVSLGCLCFRMHVEKCMLRTVAKNLEAKTSLKVSIIVPFGFVVCDREGTALSH